MPLIKMAYVSICDLVRFNRIFYQNTALHLAAAENAAEAVLYLLNQLMHTRDVVEAITRENTDGFTPLDLVIRNKNERTALTFINHDHWKPLLMQYSKIHGTAVLGLIRHLPDAMRRLLDRCVTPPLHDEKGSFIEYDYTVLHHSTHATKVGHQGRSFNVPMRALKTMAVLRRSELLAHPVCSTLLERKWYSGQLFSVKAEGSHLFCTGIIMASNLVFVSVLSYVMMSTVERDLRTHLLRQSFENVERNHPDGCAAVNGSEFDFIRERIRQGREQPFSDTPALMVLGISLVIIFFKELAELRSEGPRYLLQWMNYMEMALFICSGGFVFCFYQDYRAHDVGPATYQFGALAIFLAWFNLLRFFRPFGTFGLYSFMFFTILRTLIQVSAFFFILTAAFTAATQTLFYTKIYPNNTDYYKRHSDLSPDDLRTIHEDVTITALRIGAMTIGDLDSLDNFMVPFMDGMLAYPELSFVFYAIFLVLMPILLNNLLMGLAIGDMEAIRENAISLRLEMQVYLHESLERLFPQRFLQRLQKQSETYRIYKGAPVGFLTKVARWMQTGDKSPEYLVQGNTVGVDEKAEEEANEKEENFTLQRRLKNLEEAAQEQRQLLNQILTKLERAPASGASEDVFAASIAEKARKRSERTEEDRRHAQRIQLLRKQASYQDSLRSDQSGDIDS